MFPSPSGKRAAAGESPESWLHPLRTEGLAAEPSILTEGGGGASQDGFSEGVGSPKGKATLVPDTLTAFELSLDLDWGAFLDWLVGSQHLV